MKYIVDIKGNIEGDYEIIGKYEERPQDEWIIDELCRLRSCLRSGLHVGSYLQTQNQMNRFIAALDEVIPAKMKGGAE